MHVSAGVNSSFVAKVLYLRAETPRQGGETVRNLIQTSLYIRQCQATYFPEREPHQIFLTCCF